MTESNEQIASEISLRIKQLESFSPDDLKTEMGSIKKALMENAQACQLLKPEDIGLLVESITKITGKAIASAATTKKESTKKKKLSPEELADALNSDEF